MGQALYRKYRSKSLDEIVGQEHITKTLGNALKTGKISHAYLLTGPRGVGKTSVARILAHAVNDLPYTDDSVHLDIIEIDAASNRRIDEVRDLREKVHISPTSAKYKVYIIDEVHMLTKEAFNALLKTLEEPPAHVIFILATTEAHKLPETIVSRTQRFSFKSIEPVAIQAHLKYVAKQEGLKVDDDALALIAEHSDGSFRDALSLLDQASNTDKHISHQEVMRLLGIAPQAAIQSIIEALEQGNPKVLVTTLQQLREQGYPASQLAKQLSHTLRQQVVQTNTAAAPLTMRLLRQLLDVPTSQHSEQLLELILLDTLFSTQPAATEPVSASKSADQPAKKAAIKATGKPKGQPPSTPANTTVFSIELWPEVLKIIKRQHNTLYGILRMGQPAFDGQTLTLGFRFPFHQKRISDDKNRHIIMATIEHLTGQTLQLECIVDETIEPPESSMEAKKDPADSTVDTISNIFGGAELLES